MKIFSALALKIGETWLGRLVKLVGVMMCEFMYFI